MVMPNFEKIYPYFLNKNWFSEKVKIRRLKLRKWDPGTLLRLSNKYKAFEQKM